MATAYHRRPRPDALDIAAVAHAKLGSGSAWQGFYMYTGGTNPGPGLEETQATGYPNDMARLSYDFHAPIGEAGRIARSHAALRLQHAFIEAFGERLAPMPSHLPTARPHGVEDAETLRWAVRADDGSGFVFIGWHQPHVPLSTYRGAQFRIETPDGVVTLPSTPVDIPPGTLARWPLGLEVGGVTIDWATASAVTVLPGTPASGSVPTLVLIEDAGLPVEIAHDGLAHRVTPGPSPLRIEEPHGAALDVLVLPSDEAARVWVVDAAAGGRRLFVGSDELTWDAAGTVSVRAGGSAPDVREYAGGAWRELAWEHVGGAAVAESAAGRGGASGVDCRPAATGRAMAGRRRRMMPCSTRTLRCTASTCPSGSTKTPCCGCAGRATSRSCASTATVATDRFWDGSELVANLRDIGASPATRVELHVLPLRRDSSVHLPADAAARLAASGDGLCALDAAEIDQRALWREALA